MGSMDTSGAVLMAGAGAAEMTSSVGLADAKADHRLSGRSNTRSINDGNVRQRRPSQSFKCSPNQSLNRQPQRQQQHQGEQQQQQTPLRRTRQQSIRQQQQQQQLRPPPKAPRIHNPSRHFYSHLYLLLFVISVICISALSIAAPAELRSRAEQVVLGFLGCSAVLSLLTVFVLRYKPSRKSATLPIRMEVDGLGTFELKSLACMAAIVFLVLWTCIGTLVLFIPEEDMGVAGQVEVWNANLYFGTWLGYFISCWVFADGCVTCSSSGNDVHHHRTIRSSPNNNPQIKARNGIARGWILLLIFSLVLVVFSSSILGGPICAGSPLLGESTMCKRIPFGIVIGISGALLAAIYWVIRMIHYDYDCNEDTTNEHILQWSTLVDRASFGLCTIALSVFAIASFLATATSRGIMSEWIVPCNTYFASWTCFGICLRLFLNHFELWSVQTRIQREAGATCTGMEQQRCHTQAKMDGTSTAVEKVQPWHIPTSYHKAQPVQGQPRPTQLEATTTNSNDTHGYPSSSSSSSSLFSSEASSYSFTYDEKTGMTSTSTYETSISGSSATRTSSTSISATSTGGSTSYLIESGSTYTGPTTLSHDQSSDPAPLGVSYQSLKQYDGGHPPCFWSPRMIPSQQVRGPKPDPCMVSSENMTGVTYMPSNRHTRPPDPEMKPYHGRGQASRRDPSSKDIAHQTTVRSEQQQPVMQERPDKHQRNQQYVPTKQTQHHPQPQSPCNPSCGMPQPVRDQQKQPPIILLPANQTTQAQQQLQQKPKQQQPRTRHPIHKGEPTQRQKLEQKSREKLDQKLKEKQCLQQKLVEREKSSMIKARSGRSRPSWRPRPPLPTERRSGRPVTQEKPRPAAELKSSHRPSTRSEHTSTNHRSSAGRSRHFEHESSKSRRPSQLEPEQSSLGSSIINVETPCLHSFSIKEKQPTAPCTKAPNPQAFSRKDTMMAGVQQAKHQQQEEEEMMRKVQASSFNDRQQSHSHNRRESLFLDPKVAVKTSVGLLIEQAMSELKREKDQAALELDREKQARAQFASSTRGMIWDEMVESVISGFSSASNDTSQGSLTACSTAMSHGPLTISEDELGLDDRARMEAIEIAALASASARDSSNEKQMHAPRLVSNQARGDYIDVSVVLSPEPFRMERRGMDPSGVYSRHASNRVSDICKTKVLTELTGAPAGQISPSAAINPPIIRLPPKLQHATNAPPRSSLVKARFQASVFHQFDTNIDGAINHNEMKEMLRQTLNITLTDDQTEHLFNVIGTDGDGKISVAEFEDWCFKQSFGSVRTKPPEQQQQQRTRENISSKESRASVSSIQKEPHSQAASVSSFKTESFASGKTESDAQSQGGGSLSHEKPSPGTEKKESHTISLSKLQRQARTHIDIQERGVNEDEDCNLSPLSDLGTQGSSCGTRRSSSTPTISERKQQPRFEMASSKSTMSFMSSQTIPNNIKITADQMVAAALEEAQKMKERHHAMKSSPERFIC